MANVSLQPSRPGSGLLAALDAELERVDRFFCGFFADGPEDLRNILHHARIRRMTAAGGRGQAMI